MNLAEHYEDFQRRMLQDALAEATADYWLRRADAFEAAKPRHGDYHGRATTEDLRTQWRRLDALVKSCRARAAQAPFEDTTLVEAVLKEAA